MVRPGPARGTRGGRSPPAATAPRRVGAVTPPSARAPFRPAASGSIRCQDSGNVIVMPFSVCVVVGWPAGTSRSPSGRRSEAPATIATTRASVVPATSAVNHICRQRAARRRPCGAAPGAATWWASSRSRSRSSRSRSFTCPHSSGSVRGGSPSHERPSSARPPRSSRAPRRSVARRGRRSSGARRPPAASPADPRAPSEARRAARGPARRPSAARAARRRYAASTLRCRNCEVHALTTARRRYASNASGCRRCRKRPTEWRKASWAMSCARSASPVIR